MTLDSFDLKMETKMKNESKETIIVKGDKIQYRLY